MDRKTVVRRFERRRIESDRAWWIDEHPNHARNAVMVQRGSVIFGKDHVRLVAGFKQK